MVARSVVVRLHTGLHLRPAALFVQEAGKFNSEITIERNGKKADAKSIMGVMSLAVGQGSEVVLTAEGEDERDAIETLVRFLSSDI